MGKSTCGKFLYDPWVDSHSWACCPVLNPSREQHLMSHTDSQQRCLVIDTSTNDVVSSSAAKLIHARRKGPHSRNNETISIDSLLTL
jgi:hypothetical protein